MSGYGVIIEHGDSSFGAYTPELPGLGVAGDSLEEVERLIREAIPLHIESLRAQGEPVPPPSTVATMIIAAPAADLPPPTLSPLPPR
ncbi:MAG TPA: type II toxin-antitoxin system HicB family antitoxin [Actinomycetes bacterium]|nr:type II toxin-antitoxin system HicB family antitoxin [Actinomycetes bacterium]